MEFGERFSKFFRRTAAATAVTVAVGACGAQQAPQSPDTTPVTPSPIVTPGEMPSASPSPSFEITPPPTETPSPSFEVTPSPSATEKALPSVTTSEIKNALLKNDQKVLKQYETPLTQEEIQDFINLNGQLNQYYDLHIPSANQFKEIFGPKTSGTQGYTEVLVNFSLHLAEATNEHPLIVKYATYMLRYDLTAFDKTADSRAALGQAITPYSGDKIPFTP